MELKLFQIDAFADNIFQGNPAAVCPLREWLPEQILQAIAMENNLSETAYFVPTPEGFHIRWFTPVNEVKLCGHATLASAYALFSLLDYDSEEILFDSASGPLRVRRRDDLLEMDFPAQTPNPCAIPEALAAAFDDTPIACLKAEDYILVFDDEATVRMTVPDLSLLKTLDLRGVAITAAAENYDFVSRFFAPKYGIDEDPVTGSSFTQLVPYWSKVLNKSRFKAKQTSRRGGEVICEQIGERVKIAGRAIKYLEGTITVPLRDSFAHNRKDT